ncbi:MAG TPA: recombinase family protein [Vicinamibacterales bacterium]|jgi:site-specific DNA recombinase
MIAAIYARKSTLQRGDEETKSVARQIADARAFAKRMRFPVVRDHHVYADDAVSGRDVRNLKERARLMADVEAGVIQIVIMADMSRFSRREGDEVVRELRQIARKAQVWFYESGSRYQADDSGAKIAAFANAVINNDYPRKIAIKTLAAQKMKAGLGYVMGGRTFGYRNVDVMTGQTDGSGRPIRSHVTREIDPEQANVVVLIYERYAAGRGYKANADELNRRGLPTPRPKPGRVRGWDASSVRAVLLQPLYRGIARSNRLRQHDDEGNPIFEINPETEHVIAVNESWRIVSPELAEAVNRRFAENKANGVGFGKKSSRGGLASPKHLLTGKLRCPVCGGTFTGAKVAQRPGSKAAAKYVYECAVHRRKGDSVCSNALRASVETVDTGALQMLTGELSAAFVDRVMRLSDGSDADSGRQRLEAERDGLTDAINRLLSLAEAGAGDVSELAAKLKTRTAEREALNRRIALLPAPTSRAELRAVLEKRVADWKARLLSEFRDETRFVLDQLLQSRSIVVFGIDFESEEVVGFFDDDNRGKEGIEPEDCFGLELSIDLTRARATVEMVAGARNQHYLQLWRPAA